MVSQHRSRVPVHEAPHVAPLEVLAQAAIDIALGVEQAVLGEGKHADRAIAGALRSRARQLRGPALGLPDQRFISQSISYATWTGACDPRDGVPLGSDW